MLASITELVLLDRFWTAEVRTATEGAGPGGPGREDLGALVVQLERLLVEVELRARGVAAAGTRRGAALSASFAALTSEDSPFEERHRAQILELVDSRTQGDFPAFVEAAAADAAKQLEPERASLRTEFEKVRKGGGSGGDLTAEEERALAELAVVASVVFGPEAGIVVEAVGHLLDWLFG
jgi:hypothetical protein